MKSLTEKSIHYLNHARVALIARESALLATEKPTTRQMQQIAAYQDAILHIRRALQILHIDDSLDDVIQHELPE